MGRRALPKIDASIDYSAYLKTFEQLPNPWAPATLFGRTAPLEIEVGSGKGLFLRNSAADRPAVDFLGIEVAKRYAEFAAASLAKQDSRNALVVRGDAIRIFAELVPNDSLAAVHVYFPDPWWKTRHRKRRVMRESFVRDIQRTLRPGGSLHFWTDVQEYFQVTLTLLAAKTSLVGPLEVPEPPAEHDMAYRTHFERRMRLKNEAVYRSEFRKPTGDKPTPIE
jgi:tRNA (guanine-N7-)-methyltransferase